MIRKISHLLILFLLFIPALKGQEVQLESMTDADPGEIEIDLNMLGFTGANGDVGAITYKIDYPTDLITFQGLSFEHPEFAPITANVYNDQLIIVATDMQGVDIDGLFTTLKFDYAGSFPADLMFATEECEITTTDFITLNPVYTNGSILPNVSNAAGMIMIGAEVAPAGDNVNVPVQIEGDGFDAVSAISLKIAYDTDKLSYEGLSSNEYGFVENAAGGLIEMEWTGEPQDFSSIATLFNLDFVYNGGGLAPIEFEVGSLVSDPTQVLSTEFINGSVDMEIPGGNRSLSIAQVNSEDSTMVNVPITAENFENDAVGNITMNIAYDNNSLDYSGFVAEQFTGWSVSSQEGSVTLTKTDYTGLTLMDGALVTLMFDYTAGEAEIAFEAGTIVQNTDLENLPVNLIDGFVTGAGQLITLDQGFQFVSSRFQPNEPDLLVVLEEILDDRLDFVRNNEGSMLTKLGPIWVNNIGDWQTTDGYLFRMNEPAEFSVSGSEIDPQTPISLGQGFQMISYLPSNPIDALEAFESILTDDLEFIRDSEGAMLVKLGPIWVNNIGDALPGEGYLVKMNAADELIYPAAKKSSLNGEDPETSYFKFEGGNPAEAVYTLYVDGDVETGDEIAAFDGDKMVGAAVITSDNKLRNDLPLFTELFSGKGYEAGNEISLKVYDRSENVVSTVNYTMQNEYNGRMLHTFPAGDGEYGIAKVEKSTTGIETIDANAAVYPNPAHSQVNIHTTQAVENVRVFNYTGQLMFDQNVSGTHIEINVADFDSGVYILEIKTVSGVFTEKLTVK